MKLYYCEYIETHYIVRDNPLDYASCIGQCTTYQSSFKNFEVAEKKHMFRLVGNNCKWLNIIDRRKK